MAESNVQSDRIRQEEEEEEQEQEQEQGKKQQQQQQRLKYLDFVHVAAIQVLVCFWRLYDFAKENSGPLKPGVQTVEGTVKAVVGPVYEKFHHVPSELLEFVDRKVGESVEVVRRHVPSLVKEAPTQAYTVVLKAPEVARSVAGEVQRAGAAAYTKAEPAAERCAASAWRSLKRLPLFPQVARVVVPTAAYWSDKYNRAVCYSAEKGYAVSAYLPLVPTERIAKVFGGEGEEVKAASE